MNALLRLVRAAATAPLLRRLTSVGPLLRISFALRASLVRERRRFVRNELRRGPVTATYRLRESGVAIALRHHTGDVMVLDEIFSQREYEPPREIELGSVESAVDLGANIGLFGAWLLGRAPAARIVGYEPDPGNAAVHRRALEANGLGERWRLVEAFAGTDAGTTSFTAGLHATSHEGSGIEVPVVDVLPELAQANLVKIDVEGAEWPLLADPRFRELAAAWIVLEYHAEGCPASDPRAAAEEALRAAGFEVVHTQRKPAFGAGLVWGYRSAQSSPWPAEKSSELSIE
jgi:FkbM family methyltransferase